MRNIISLFISVLCATSATAGNPISLDSCRSMALARNKQLNITKLRGDIANEIRKSAKTKYLPKIDAVGGYNYFSKEISLLSSNQKNALNNIGTNLSSSIGSNAEQIIGNLINEGIITQEASQTISSLLGNISGPLVSGLDAFGQNVTDAFKTDTKNIWSGAIMARQPIFMGGAIVAANRIAELNVQIASYSEDLLEQAIINEIDQTYWMVVSLKNKLQLARSYSDLVKKLDQDVESMIKQGVATRADGLKVKVKVNEADVTITEVENGLSLARMLLCQLCGLPLDTEITLADEDTDSSICDESYIPSNISGADNRPEMKIFTDNVKISQEITKMIRAEYLPHVFLTGGYLITNPNIYNGFQNKFSGVWNVGVTVQVPIWNWMDCSYKVKASKNATLISQLELSDAKEKIDLQISQCRYKLTEAYKRLNTSRQNLESANENLRCANIGFKEGIIESTDVMAAQTAWENAQSIKISAEIEVKLAQVSLEKALGVLRK